MLEGLHVSRTCFRIGLVRVLCCSARNRSHKKRLSGTLKCPNQVPIDSFAYSTRNTSVESRAKVQIGTLPVTRLYFWLLLGAQSTNRSLLHSRVHCLCLGTWRAQIIAVAASAGAVFLVVVSVDHCHAQNGSRVDEKPRLAARPHFTVSMRSRPPLPFPSSSLIGSGGN
jgi:hypothetical protein